ncbi:hypothetical protein CDAR_316151 [Caerostris darwini]|uniref:Uncharacterized protein n=1 Tax=Caerostris darwini TaxID=1538125 RepID=A0AAV4QEP1_9ARAC|nr:hypothetical protein CDAR_316151 [Caerostris darwini]
MIPPLSQTVNRSLQQLRAPEQWDNGERGKKERTKQTKRARETPGSAEHERDSIPTLSAHVEIPPHMSAAWLHGTCAEQARAPHAKRPRASAQESFFFLCFVLFFPFLPRSFK